MLHDLRTRACAFTLAAALTALAGCAEMSVLSIPRQSVATVAKLKNKILSKEEQDSAIRDLSVAQESHRGVAIEEIEKR